MQAYTFILNIIEFAGGFIPALLYNNQVYYKSLRASPSWLQIYYYDVCRAVFLPLKRWDILYVNFLAKYILFPICLMQLREE